MKKKVGLILASLGASALLAGGAVAAYVVTDNAPALHSQISGGDIVDFNRTGKVTLSYGQGTALTDVDNLKVNTTRKAGVVVLAVEESKAGTLTNGNYQGVLNVQLQDLTVHANQSDPKLIDHVTVKIIQGEVNLDEGAIPAAAVELGTLDSAHLTAAINITTNKTTAAKVTVFVNLAESARESYDEIKDDQLYVTVDWNKASGDTDAADDVHPIYMYDEHDVLGNAPFVYAWGEVNNEEVRNHEFPGEAMTKVADHLWSFELPTVTDNFLFVGNNKQTANLAYDENNLYWTIGSEIASGEDQGKYAASKGNVNPVTLADYYMTGDINGVEHWSNTEFKAEWAMGAGDENNYAILENVTFQAGDTLKIVGKDGTWYGAGEGQENDGTGNALVSTAGVYNVYLSKNGGVYIGAPTNSGN